MNLLGAPPRVWIEAARPRTLPAAISPVLVGTAASDNFIVWRFALAAIVALAIQVGVNLANDLFDAQRGVDTEQRVGPRRATASGLVTPKQMRLAIILAFAVAAVAGLALAICVNLWLLAVGAASFIAALTYSGGSKPYASLGLGEVFVFVFFGLVATVGSSFVQDEQIHQIAYVAAIPVGLLATAILVVNNLRDLETDRAAGKMTLAVRLGEHRTRILYQALVVVAFLDTGAVVAVTRSALPLLALIAVPFAVGPVGTVLRSRESSELVGALAGTARLQLAYSGLLAVGLWAWN